jgi:hypothetical protein
MRVKPSSLVLTAVVLCLVGIGAGIVLATQRDRRALGPSSGSDAPLNAVYVWQHKWSTEVVSGIRKASRASTVFMVLGAEITLDDGNPHYRMPNVDWRALASTARPVWVVIRVHELPDIRSAEGQKTSVEILVDVTRPLIDAMARSGVQASGVQLDYDCAAEDLAHYASLLRLFRERVPGVPVSLTALPSWLRHRDLPIALAEADHYVLQVHSIEPPVRIDDPLVLCDTARVPGWLEDAASLSVPFYLALPTYGYRLIFAPGGEFVGLTAEQVEESRVGYRTREIVAEPSEVAALVRTLRCEPPPLLLGIAWFRLPVEGDRLNWSWPLLEKVMKGQAPKLDVRAEVRSPSSNLHEVWVTNQGLFCPTEPIHIRVDWTNGTLVAHDALAEFRVDPVLEAAGHLVGKAPGPGEERMAAWFRLAPAEGEKAPALHAGAVEALR